MIGKITTGSQFLPICRYALAEEAQAQVVASSGVRWWSAEALAADFETQRASLRPALGEASLHVALSWPPEESEKITNSAMAQLGRRFLQEMDIDPEQTQWCLIRHGNQEHPHGHLLVNRVTHAGGVVDLYQDYERSAAACRQLEREYGLVDAAERGRVQRQAQPREEEAQWPAARLAVRAALDEHLPAQTSLPGLGEALAREGVALRVHTNPQGELRGVSFTHRDYPDLPMKGSQLGPDYAGPQLSRRLADHAVWAADPDATRPLFAFDGPDAVAEWEERHGRGSSERGGQTGSVLVPPAADMITLCVTLEDPLHAARRLGRVREHLTQQGATVDTLNQPVGQPPGLTVSFAAASSQRPQLDDILRLVSESGGFTVQVLRDNPARPAPDLGPGRSISSAKTQGEYER